VYCFDTNGFGQPNNWLTGYCGYAFLETPGNATNGIDDDDDGMIDERRDDGIDNDNDWKKFTDLNGNNVWDSNEPLNDDLGRDGLGPLSVGYPGPDEGEGDGIPTSGEPNFDATDKDESDQIGLTAVSIYRLGAGGTGGGWPKDDESMWLKMSSGTFDTLIQNANISMVLASGTFPLIKSRRERFSMALLFGDNLNDLIYNKRLAQAYFNNNYSMPDSINDVKKELIPDGFYLSQNFPNPFNPVTTINYSLPKAGNVKLSVYNAIGSKVAILMDEYKPAGNHSIQFNGSNLASGIYLYRLESGNYSDSKKLIFLK
jgi:hypothetical protein